MGWRHLDAAGVEEKFGVPPTLIADYLALIGDTSDNIPGLKGVGPKTAVKWLKQYGGLEAVLAAADTIEPARFAEQIKAEADRIRSNLNLVRFQTHFEVQFGNSPTEDTAAVAEFLSAMEMHSTLRKYQAKHGLVVPEVAKVEPPSKPKSSQGELF
jgi:DNA polymerase-1